MLRSEPETCALSAVVFVNCVAWFCPFHWITELGVKPPPEIFSVKLDVPTATSRALPGDPWLMNGLVGGATLKAAAGVSSPVTRSMTVTANVPGCATSACSNDAVTCVADCTVVVRGLPFHLTTEPGEKFVPVTTIENGVEPAVVDEGERRPMSGAVAEART